MKNNAILKYIAALGLIAIFAILAGFSVQTLIESQKTSASVINISGRQRMYSQRIALFANSLNLATDSIEIIRHKQVIRQLRNDMEANHDALLNGNNLLNLPKIESKAIFQIYFHHPINLNQQIEAYLKDVDVFLNTKDSIERKNAFIIINASASGRLLISFDMMLNQHVKETNQRVRKMEIRVLIAVFAIISLLILEYFFIFRPLMRSINRNKQKLTRQNIRLESLNQDLEQFIYAASHDLKTPIRGLHNLMQFLEVDFSEELTQRSKEYIDLIKNRVKRINVLIDGLMRFGAISRERTTQTTYDLDKFVERFVKNHNSETVEIQIDSKLPTLVINPIWINEIFSNLIENAVKHNQNSICKINIGHTVEKYYYQFYIKDNGQGVDEKYHEKMFKLFQTLNNEHENPTAGIGLAIVKKIVTELGGKVWIDSKVNQHFIVYFTIPKEVVQ